MDGLGEGLRRRIRSLFEARESQREVRAGSRGGAALLDVGAITSAAHFASFFSALRQLSSGQRFRTGLFIAGLFAVGLLYRLPLLLNPAGPSLNSDVAVVGLQAKHMLEGEFSFFLWGTDYQSSFDALVLAPLFLVFGATPSVAMVGPLLGFIIIIGLAFDVLRRGLSEWQAAVCCLFLVFIPPSASQYTLFAPRIWSVTAVFLSIWLIDRSAEQRQPALYLGLGGCVMMLSTFMDMFTLQWLPAVGMFALLCMRDRKGGWRDTLRRAGMTFAGAVVGGLLIALVRGDRGESQVTSMDIGRFERNYELLRDGVWSWLFNFKGEITPAGTNPDIYQAALLGRALQLTGVLILVILLVVSAVAFFVPRLPWKLRRTAALAAITAACSIAGFLVSTSPMDLASARYLTPLLWMAPFAAAVPAYLLQKPTRVLALSWPYLALAVSSSCSVVPIHDGLLTPAGLGAPEYALRDWLRSQHIEFAMAGYWDSYRLAFLFDERPQVIPSNPRSDRHKETRRDFAIGERATYIFRSSGPSEADRNEMRRKHASYATSSDFLVGDYIVVLWTPQASASR